MGILSSNKSASKDRVACGESMDITLSLSASPDLKAVPKEIVLVLDKSGSMTGEPIDMLKKAALKFMEIYDKESDGIKNGLIGGESKVGLVSFSTTATIDSRLTNSTQIPIQKINVMSAQGSTNHADAFTKAIDVLSQTTGKEKIIILFTDGDSNSGQEGFAVARKAKEMGITIYCIGYSKNIHFSIQDFERWASEPGSSHVMITPDLNELEKAFTMLIQNIAKPGGTQISITDTVDNCFDITGNAVASKGTVNVLDPHKIQWNLDSLGVTEHESATCTFTVTHTGNCTGEILVNEKTEYRDNENNVVDFISPKVKVSCQETAVIPEPCPVPANVSVDSCNDFVQFDAGNVELRSLGRIIQVDFTLKNICPEKEVALTVLLYELDELGNEQSRGMKTIVVPPQTGTRCKDIRVRCVNFVVADSKGPEKVSSLCEKRNFSVRVIGNYTSAGFVCCK